MLTMTDGANELMKKMQSQVLAFGKKEKLHE